MDAALAVEDLAVRFPGAGCTGDVLAVDGISLAVARGEIQALIGESGSGKSVTLLALAGLLPPTARISGRIWLEGRPLHDLPARARAALRGRGIGMVFQDPAGSLNPVLTAGSQLDEVVTVHQGLRGRAARRESEALLARVGIGDPARRARAFPHQLSGGMKQRVAIAMALAARPAVLLADEPTTALDATVQAQIFDLLVGLVEEERLALLLVTHDLSVAAAVADRIAVLYAGRIVEQRPAASLVVTPAHPYTRALTQAALPFRAAANRDRRLPGLPGSTPPAGGSGCAFATRCPLAVARCRSEAPPLEGHADGTVACWRAGESAP